MKKLFIHYPLFRLLSPLASGALVYTLILLINNNVEQLLENFLGEELYICIGLSFLIQEFARLSIVVLRDMEWHDSFFLKSLLQFLVTVAVSSFLVTLVMNIYFRYFLGYSPNFSEIAMFNILFSFITLIYWLLYTGHQLLFMINKDRIAKEEEALKAVDLKFKQFKSEINTELLFECLENLLLVMREDRDRAEETTDQFAMLYRYMLARRADEIIDLSQEIETVKLQTEVYNNLPYRRVYLNVNEKVSGYILPLTLIKVVEKIIKSSIVSPSNALEISIKTNERDWIVVSYEHSDKLTEKLDNKMIDDVIDKYKYYSDKNILIKTTGKLRQIFLPKLILG